MWEKMIFQPNTFSPEDPLAVRREPAPVSTEAPLIRIVKHSQETNKRTIRHCHRRQGQGGGSSLSFANRIFLEFTKVEDEGLCIGVFLS